MTFNRSNVLIFGMESEANTAVKDAILKRVKRLIEASPMTMDEIGDEIGANGGAIRQWGRRTIPPMWHLKDFCDLMGCSIEYLITGKDRTPAKGVHTASGIADAYSALAEKERPKARGFLKVIFDEEDATNENSKERPKSGQKKITEQHTAG